MPNRGLSKVAFTLLREDSRLQLGADFHGMDDSQVVKKSEKTVGRTMRGRTI